MAERKPIEVAVLNTIQAVAADIIVSKEGGIKLNDGTIDLINEILKNKIVSSTKTAFAAGTASDKDYDFNGLAADDTQFTLKVSVETFPATEESPRSYTIWTGTGATDVTIRDAFITEINSDTNRKVEASAGAGDILTLILKDVTTGDFTTDTSGAADVPETVSVAYVAPAGTPALVDAVSSGLSAPTGEYTTYDIIWKRGARNNAISGAFTEQEVTTRVFPEEGATNFAAFVAVLDSLLAFAPRVLILADAAVALDFDAGEISIGDVIQMTPTADRIVTINNAPAGFNTFVVNLSAGAFDVAIKPSTGTAVDVAQNKRNAVYFTTATQAYLLVA